MMPLEEPEGKRIGVSEQGKGFLEKAPEQPNRFVDTRHIRKQDKPGMMGTSAGQPAAMPHKTTARAYTPEELLAWSNAEIAHNTSANQASLDKGPAVGHSEPEWLKTYMASQK